MFSQQAASLELCPVSLGNLSKHSGCSAPVQKSPYRRNRIPPANRRWFRDRHWNEEVLGSATEWRVAGDRKTKRQGGSIQKISELTGFNPKTIRKFLTQQGQAPVYGPRKPRPSKLDRFQPYIEERLKAGVWSSHRQVRFPHAGRPEKDRVLCPPRPLLLNGVYRPLWHLCGPQDRLGRGRHSIVRDGSSSLPCGCTGLLPVRSRRRPSRATRSSPRRRPYRSRCVPSPGDTSMAI